MRTSLLAAVLGIAVALGACGDDDDVQPADAAPKTLYERLGGRSGVEAIVRDMIDRMENDDRINGYFLNATLDRDRLIDCLIRQIGNATGGPQIYPDPDNRCRSMADAHAGLGVSTQDFADFAALAREALDTAVASDDDVNEVMAALAAHESAVVEDPDDDLTIYQRVGRKPAIGAVVDLFLANVLGDDQINGFFADADAARLRTCLVRFVCSLDGPCEYGREVEHPRDPGVTTFTHCAGMVQAHAGMVDDVGNPILVADFNVLVGHLITALDDGGVAEDDKNAILGALGPLCGSIVSDPRNC